MDHFQYVGGQLHAEGVPIADIAAAVGTPVYVYSTATLERHYRVLADAVIDLAPLICFAVKANANVALVSTLARLGAGADVVSGGELETALAAGVPAHRIVYSGVGKTDAELALALERNVSQINIESIPELERLDWIASATGRRARVAIRVNPDVDPQTHEKISTGRAENKFGIEWTAAGHVAARADALPGIDLIGLAVHIGSQLHDLQPFRDAFHRLRDLAVMLRAAGHLIETLDIGGGLGIPYGNEPGPAPTPHDYGEIVRTALGDLGIKLIMEPGRMIVGNAGILVARVIYVKEGATRRFAILDAGMNDLLRPSLYGAFHQIIPVEQAPNGQECLATDIVGPICETGDTFATQYPLVPLDAGALAALRSVGAYGAVMASTYNCRGLPAEVLVKGDRFAVIARRQTIDDILARQQLPEWLAVDAEPGTVSKTVAG